MSVHRRRINAKQLLPERFIQASLMLLFSLLIWNNQTTQLIHCLKLAWNEQKVYRKGQHALIVEEHSHAIHDPDQHPFWRLSGALTSLIYVNFLCGFSRCKAIITVDV